LIISIHQVIEIVYRYFLTSLLFLICYEVALAFISVCLKDACV